MPNVAKIFNFLLGLERVGRYCEHLEYFGNYELIVVVYILSINIHILQNYFYEHYIN